MISEKRRLLLAELESIIGHECYSSSIQNREGNRLLGEGREFRYPLTYTIYGSTDVKLKGQGASAKNLKYEQLRDAHYSFGTTRMNIIRGLEKVLEHLEAKHGLQL